MAVVQGNEALASDYNTLKDEVNKWFADNYAGSISFGNVNQTYGWGGAEVSAVIQGQGMTAAQMNALINRCNIGVDICSPVSGALSQIIAGNSITAAEFNAIETKSDTIDTNRLTIDPLEMSIGGGGSASRSTSWSGSVYAEYTYTFTSFDEQRYFFNSGGAMTFNGSITGYSTGTGWDGTGFDEIFTNMGTVTMDYTQTTQSGSGGIPQSIGFYDLTTSMQGLLVQTGTGVYSNAVLTLGAARSVSGYDVIFQVVLIPESGRSVDGTVTCYSQRKILNAQSSGGVGLTITAPSYSLTQNF